MKSYSDYFQVLDEIRIARGFTIFNLCEGIISERTYYRYLNSEANIRFDLFNKLAKKMKVEPHEIIQYAVFVRKGDPGITRFMYRVHVHHFDDIKDIYNEVIKIPYDDSSLSLLLKAYIANYEYIINKISQDQYRQILNEIFELNKNFNYPNINLTTFNTLYLLEFQDNENVCLRDVANQLLETELTSGILFQAFAYDNLLRLYLLSNNINEELFSKLVVSMKKLVGFFPHKYFRNRYLLYESYQGKLTGNDELTNQELYRYLLGNVLLLSKDDYQKEENEVQRLFGIDVIAYLKNRLNKRI